MATVWIILAQVVCLQLISATIMNIAYGKEASMSSQNAGHVASTAVDGLTTNAVFPGGIINTAAGQTTAWWKVDLARNVQEATVKIYFRTDLLLCLLGTLVSAGVKCKQIRNIGHQVNQCLPNQSRLSCYTATITNIAYGKKANISSQHSGHVASTAVDGNIYTEYSKGGVINTAAGQTTAWSKVDLMRYVQEATAKIYFRTDYKYRRNGVQLYTSTTPFSMYPSGQLCHTVTGRANGTDIPDVVSVNCTGTWRYLMVYTQTNNDGQGAVLDYGELEVLACSTGNYGLNCAKSCKSRQCDVTPTSCYRYNATCPERRCKTGWTGSDCSEVCLTGSYGQNCMKSCAYRQCAVKPASCNIVTGACPSGGCLAGYNGSDCTQVCLQGTYGPACNMSCGNRKCTNSLSSCDFVTGKCEGECQPGWNGSDCTQMCLQGTYGPACNMSCGNRKCTNSLSSCNFVTGKCEGECQPGWKGSDCTQMCLQGTYGPACNMSCGNRKCADSSSSCNFVTGKCEGECQPGWNGSDCTQKCPDGTYGTNCSNCSMRNCKGKSGCPTDGTCSDGCQDGWTLPTCTQVCDEGSYGPGCNQSCGNCADAATCDHRTGNCPGDCAAGWQQDKCIQECGGERYGVNCAEACGQCVDKCNATNGHCQGGCQAGYTGTLCKGKLQTGYIIPVVAGATAGLLVTIIVIVFFIIYRRRRNVTSQPSKSSGKRPLFATNGSSPDRSLKNEANVYVNVAMEPVEGKLTMKLVLHDKPKPTQADPTRKPKAKEDGEEEEEIQEESEPLPNRDYYNDIEDVIREIPVEELEDTVQKIRHRKGGFEAEYGRLPTGFTASYDDSRKSENTVKNRFIGYYPYDYNRVRLSLLPDILGSDYINASILHSYDQRKTYIAAQAPKQQTVGDFWRMIWEQRCGRVIMLTGLVEDKRVKCSQYWPVHGELETNHFWVKVEVTDTRANYTVRDIEIKSKETGEVRGTVQYHYTSWPDHGIPDTLALVNFIWMIRRTYRETDGPLLVHCSAGIGRTGTYIAVDSLLDQAREEGMVDVLGYVLVMRGQRKNMIQTKEQYECVFQCLVEMTKFGDTSMDVENFANSYNNRGMESIVDRKTLLEITQLVITEDSNSALSPPQMWLDGNLDFIVRVGPTLRLLRGYLLAETPPSGLEKLLWKLVEENNVNNAVVFSPLKVKLLGDKGTTKKFGGISLTTTGQTSLTSNLTLVTLEIKTGRSSHNINLFRLNGSLTLDNVSSLLLDHAHLQRLSAEMSPVVLIHDETDRKPTVLFCVMGNIISGIEEDRRVDVIGHVRAFRTCCPDVVFTQQDITKLLEFAQKSVQLMGTANIYVNM